MTQQFDWAKFGSALAKSSKEHLSIARAAERTNQEQVAAVHAAVANLLIDISAAIMEGLKPNA